MLGSLPDYSINIDSKSKLQSFNSEEDKDINKVILFSQKKKASAIYKALTAEFKDRLRFAFIS